MARRGGVAPSGQSTALVRPPRFASGGGAALPFGSGAPGMPRVGSKRAEMLARQYRDDARGRFTERDFCFPDSGVIAPNTVSNPQVVKIASNRSSFVRLVAIRGSVTVGNNEGDAYVPNITETAMRLSLAINGEENAMTDGQSQSYASYNDLFTTSAPWYWFAAPPRLRVGDVLQARWSNTSGNGTVFPSCNINATLVARIVDDEWWQELYGT